MRGEPNDRPLVPSQPGLLALGGHVAFWPSLAASLGVITVASVVPIPGGGSAVGTVGRSASFVAWRVPKDTAVAAALAN